MGNSPCPWPVLCINQRPRSVLGWLSFNWNAWGRGACPTLLTRTRDSEAELGRQGGRCPVGAAPKAQRPPQGEQSAGCSAPRPRRLPDQVHPLPRAAGPALLSADSPLVQAAPSGHSQMRHIQAPNPIKPGTHICFATMRPRKEPSPHPGAADIHAAGGAPRPVHPDPIVPPLIELPRDSPNSRLGKRRVNGRGQGPSAHVGGEEGASLCEALSQHLGDIWVARLCGVSLPSPVPGLDSRSASEVPAGWARPGGCVVPAGAPGPSPGLWGPPRGVPAARLPVYWCCYLLPGAGSLRVSANGPS
uniref:Uncharacterized protein n=1 Tax=Myotis myotis TaxID=51298 RepID=A0A7J7UPR0_MYOMY|nr:hypothetical protein mMyoMyo1_008539 [Myotis myotis]